MAGVLLTPSDRAHFLSLRRRQLNSAVHRRMNAILLLDDGWPAERVAEALFIEAETVRDHKRRYVAAGRSGIEQLSYVGHAPVLSSDQAEALKAEIARRIYLSAKEICGFVAAQFSLLYTPHAMAKLVGRLGFVWKRPKRVPAKADPQAQRAFLDATLAPLMAQAEVDADQPLYFVDATHPAYDAHPACGWMRRGETRVLRSNHGRVNVTLNGALSWPGRDVVTREANKITASEMIALFEQLAARHPSATAINVVIDNATYNRAAAVREWVAGTGGRVRLVYLPPYAPNLNLIERLWWFFKKKTLWNIHYPTLADFKTAIQGFFNTVASRKDELATLITNKFHFIGKEPSKISPA